jgi:superfamily II DNA or RNA helicase
LIVCAGEEGVELVVEADPSINQIVAPGILRRGDTLHPFGAQARFGQTWERLPFRRSFSKREIPELVAAALPELSKHITVDIRTLRLPEKQGRVPVWIQFNVDLVEEGIDVLPLLVYGDPPVARIDSGRLVHVAGAVPTRDEPRETDLRLRLRDRLNLVPGRRVHMAGGDAAKFLSDLESFDSGRPASAGTPAASRPGGVTLQVHLHAGDDGDFEIGFEANGVAASADAVIAAWHNGIGLVPLSDGSFARIPDGWLEEHGHLVADLLAARGLNDGRTPKALLPVLGELCAALDTPEPPELAGLRQLLDDVPSNAALHPRPAAEIAAEVCSDFQGELRGYQADGIAWLARLRDAGLGAILADDMGLGKTIQALCVLKGRCLVVCPRSVIHNWTKEIERFRPGLSVSLYHGPRRSLDDCDVTLTTYATLRNDAELLCAQEWNVVVLDESQAIKNPDSQVARTAYGLNAGFRLSLSGTPIENRLDELWSQMHFANRGLLGGRKDFARGYEAPIVLDDQATLGRLRARIKPFLLRRMKREVATELPPRTEAVLYCELDDDERNVYDSVKAASRDDIARQLAGNGGVLKALEALLRLRQAACHSGLLPGRAAATSSKVEALCEALEDAVADGHKALVFSQWTGLLDKVEPQLRARALSFIRLDGKTRDRGAVVEAFQADDGPPVMIISLTAGGTGLNLTAADHVFLLDPWWNPAVEDQAADRAHRIGQDRPVMVYRMVAKDTVEERVLELQARKRELAEAALSGTGGAGAGLTRQDILALLD